MRYWKDLTEEERTAFSAEFYAYWCENFDFEEDIDPNNPAPWGCPWDYVPNDKAVSAKEYFDAVRAEIEELAKKDQE